MEPKFKKYHSEFIKDKIRLEGMKIITTIDNVDYQILIDKNGNYLYYEVTND